METRFFQPVSEMLDSGKCEPLKACVHSVALVVAGVCALYNTAAWLKRRQSHLAINAVIYGATVWWESKHVIHHLADCVPAAKPTGKCTIHRFSDAA